MSRTNTRGELRAQIFELVQEIGATVEEGENRWASQEGRPLCNKLLLHVRRQAEDEETGQMLIPRLRFDLGSKPSRNRDPVAATAGPHRNGDILPAIDHVGTRRAAARTRQPRLVQDLAVLHVI